MLSSRRRPAVSLACLSASLGLHGALLLVAFVSAVAARPAVVADAGAWAGETFEISAYEEEPKPPLREASGQVPSPQAESEPPTEPSIVGRPASGGDRAKPPEPKQSESDAEPAPPPRPGKRSSPERSSPGRSSPGRSSPGRVGGASPEPQEGNSAESYGAEGIRARRGNLPSAFTRVLPAAARGDVQWTKLPLGPVGRFEIIARLDGEGQVTAIETSGNVPKPVARLFRVARLLLRAGRFALPAGDASGEHHLRVEVVIQSGPGSDADYAEPHHVWRIDSSLPEGDEPGVASVTYNSGRKVSMQVYVDPAR